MEVSEKVLQNHVIIDAQEPESMLVRLTELDLACEVDTMDAGDYLIMGQVIIERKAMFDFVNSIKNKSLEASARRMSELKAERGYEKIIVLFEGSMGFLKTHTGMNEMSIWGEMAHLIRDFGISFMMTNSQHATSLFIKSLVVQCSNIKPTFYSNVRVPYKKGDTPEDVLASVLVGVPLISEERASILIGHFGSLKRIANATIEELMALPGFGRKMAETVYGTFNYEVPDEDPNSQSLGDDKNEQSRREEETVSEDKIKEGNGQGSEETSSS